MQRINMTHPGGVDVLYIEDAAIPEPQAGELLIKTAWAGVNRPDIMQREGAYPMPAGVTPIMGLELSGEIVALGADVSGFAVGDRVCALTDGGADGILDLVGGRYFAQNLDCLKKDGRLYLIGFMGGNIAPEVDLLKIAVKRAHITGSTLRGRNSDEKATIAASLRETLWPMLADGRVAKPHLHRSYPWRKVAAAHTEIDRGTHIGKILLDFSA